MAGFVLFAALFVSSFGAGGSYNYLLGGEDWGTMGVCGTGLEQSPIDIPDNTYDVADDEDLIVRATFNAMSTTDTSAKFTDTTYYVSLASDAPFGSISAFKVNHKTSTTYTNCVQFHFHAPSEHTVDGEQYDLEMHIVCYYPSSGASGERNYAVLGFMFEEGDSSQFLANVISGSPSVDWTVLPGYPNFGNYYTYDGSLTTPTCDELVTWLLTSDILELSSDQLSYFTSKWA
jgi:carbonic anhydrase